MFLLTHIFISFSTYLFFLSEDQKSDHSKQSFIFINEDVLYTVHVLLSLCQWMQLNITSKSSHKRQKVKIVTQE